VIELDYALLALEDTAGDPASLDGVERARAARFVDPKSRSRFVQVRRALRAELSHRLGVPPHAVRFLYGPQGKPYLDASDLHFSVAHSGDLALLAFARGAAIGADLERVREVSHRAEIARRLFSEPDPRTLEAFFRLWVRHEAVVKCAGTSALAPAPASSAFAVLDVPAPAGYAAAVCAAAPALTIAERPLYSAG
jgi:4'-phosphopantetheinyl transferase